MLLRILAGMLHSHGKLQPMICVPFILSYHSPYFSYIQCLLTFHSWLILLKSEIIMDVSCTLASMIIFGCF